MGFETPLKGIKNKSFKIEYYVKCKQKVLITPQTNFLQVKLINSFNYGKFEEIKYCENIYFLINFKGRV